MERTKGSRANRLLVVCMCMIIATMGLQIVPGKTAAGRPPATVLYYGDNMNNGKDIYIQWQDNLISPLCLPKRSNGEVITASWWCAHFQDINGGMHDGWVRWMAYQNWTTGLWVYYDGLNKTGTDFPILAGYSYWVYARYEGYLGMDHSTYDPADGHQTYAGKSTCPRHADIRLFGDNEPGYGGYNYVGPIFWQGWTGPPPVPPPPWTPYSFWLSQFAVHLKNLDGTPYTGDWHIYQYNNTDVFHPQWEMTIKGFPTDFVHHSNYGVGYLHWGLCIYVPGPAVWEYINP